MREDNEMRKLLLFGIVLLSSLFVCSTVMASKSGSPGNFNRHYEAAKSGYKAIGKKAPSKTFLKIRKGSGLTKATKALDKAVENIDKKGQTKKPIKNYANKLKSFQSKKNKYIKTLQKEIKAEKAKGKSKNKEYIYVMKFMIKNLNEIDANAVTYQNTLGK